jgi:Ca2+-binding EF-hand superfamily protein
LAGAASAYESADDQAVEDVFYLGEDRLVAIRFRVLVEGQPYRTPWNAYLAEMFDRLDANDNGELADDELKGIPSRSTMEDFGLLTSGTVASRIGAEPDAAPRDGKVTREEFSSYFERVGLQAFRISIQAEDARMQNRLPGRNASQDAPQALLEALDSDGDGALVAREFLSAESRLSKYDLDRDEAISMAELAPVNNLFGQVVASDTRSDSSDPRFMAVSADSRRGNAQRLVQHYDGRGGAAKDRRLTAEEIGFGKEAFGQVDVDGDGALDFEETLQLLANAVPEHEIVVRLGKRQRGHPVFEVTGQLAGKDANSSSSLPLGKALLQLSANDSNPWRDLKATLVQQFKNIDRDNNGYLEEQESRLFGVQPRRFALLDRDGDGKAFEEEMLAVTTPLFELDSRRVQIQIADRGRDLFRILDTSGDGRIGRRELRAAAQRVSLWDASGDGAVVPEEIPQQFRLEVSRAMPNLTGRTAAVFVDSMGSQVQVRPTSGGPAWFNKMDRNSDGDLSASEFLGPASVFDKLDADNDGLIDAEEAARP